MILTGENRPLVSNAMNAKQKRKTASVLNYLRGAGQASASRIFY
jgi:hypothetical protein